MLKNFFFPLQWNIVRQDLEVTDMYYRIGQAGMRSCETPKTSLLSITGKAQVNTLWTGDSEPTDGNSEEGLLCTM